VRTEVANSFFSKKKVLLFFRKKKGHQRNLWYLPWDPELRESDELAAILAGLVDPVDGLLDGKLKVEPARLGVDGGSLVLLNGRGHCC
jgi:hypothetical protein